MNFDWKNIEWRKILLGVCIAYFGYHLAGYFLDHQRLFKAPVETSVGVLPATLITLVIKVLISLGLSANWTGKAWVPLILQILSSIFGVNLSPGSNTPKNVDDLPVAWNREHDNVLTPVYDDRRPRAMSMVAPENPAPSMNAVEEMLKEHLAEAASKGDMPSVQRYFQLLQEERARIR